jgi:hypothetical protein
MANLKISELPISTELQGNELFATVQNGVTKQTTINDVNNFIIPLNLSVTTGDVINLSDIAYNTTSLIKLTWTNPSGGVQVAVLNLPDATLPINTNRVLRFISNGGFTTNTHVELTPINGQTLDGSTNDYLINKPYEGIQVWSNGVEWFIIQKKG